jgi:hypothetical protein
VLPNKLKEVKSKLEAKGYASRSRDEDDLLAELEEIDKLLDSNREIVKKGSFVHDSRMTTGPTNRCSCCGK